MVWCLPDTQGRALVLTPARGKQDTEHQVLGVHFWCEMCTAKPILLTVQHKGNTYVDFVIDYILLGE